MFEKIELLKRKKQLENEISRYKNLQLAKKVQLNSAYGALGNEYFRFYDLRQAEAITLSGQLSIRWIGDQLNKYMNRLLKTKDVDYVIASDTDSVYLHLGPLVDMVYESKNIKEEKIVDFIDKACSEKIEPFIESAFDKLAKKMNAYDQKMFMKREVIANTGIWAAKKRYILNVWDSEGVRYSEPKLKMSGIEAVKSSTPGSCRVKIKQALSVIMTGTEAEFHAFNQTFKKEFSKLSFEDIAFPRSVSEISKYESNSGIYKKGTPIHVRGALIYNQLIKDKNLLKKYQTIKDGDKIKFCYMKMPNPTHENVLSVLNVLPKEFCLEKYIDYETQFDKAYLEPLKIIVNTFDWNVEPVSSLRGFFT